jgi:phage FluMu protein Com
MSSNQIDVKCPRCGFHWRPDLSELDRADQVVYRGAGETRDYRVTCPQCGTVKVITVAMGKEGDDG